MLNKEKHRWILIDILKDIYDSDIAKYLAFKWWTAVYLFHGLDRFSTDLDFDLLSSDIDIDKQLEAILSKYWKLKKWQKIKLSYGDDDDNIKIDVSRKIWKNNTYEIVNFNGRDVKMQDKATIFANKLIALTDRKSIANRDIFDIYFLFTQNFPINEKIIEERTGENEWQENNVIIIKDENWRIISKKPVTKEYLTKNEYFEYLIYFLENKVSKSHKILDWLWEVLKDEKHKAFVKNRLLTELLLILKDKIKLQYQSSPIIVSKSLFVDYTENPKVAWWKQNNLTTYKWIKWISEEETSDQLIELGQTVEDVVGEYFLKTDGLVRLDVFEDNTAKNSLDEEDEDIYIIKENYKEKRERNIKRTLQAIKNKEKLIYQPWFSTDNLFVRGDYLKLNSNWNYDLIEVKAKTWVRKNKTFKWVSNKNAGELENKFLNDISFQKYVINKVLTQENLWQLDGFYFAYLNSYYKKSWEINVKKLIVLDEVNLKQEVVLQWEENEKTIENDDTLLSDLLIEETIKTLKKELVLDEQAFNIIHKFTGSKAIEYFWKEREFGTIFWKWLTSSKAVKQLYYEDSVVIDDLTYEQQELFNKSNGEVWSARQYIINYLKAKKHWDYIDSEWIKLEFDDFKYPLCFYDYETCSVPVPFLDNTSPYQQVVVQYSLHKVYEDGKIEHFWGLLEWMWEKSVRQWDILNNPNAVDFESEKVVTGWYEDLLDEFVKDIWDDLDKTFIVWYKPFENTRNKEIAESIPKLAEIFQSINTNTYDLMDIFKKGFYYSLKFKGSNSIKFVLPAMVPNMSYDTMNIPNGLEAMQVLNKIINTDNYSEEEREEQIKDLLLYCGQDSLAMYRIYQAVLEKIS